MVRRSLARVRRSSTRMWRSSARMRRSSARMRRNSARVPHSLARVRQSSAGCSVTQLGCGVAQLMVGRVGLACVQGRSEFNSRLGTPDRFFPLSLRAGDEEMERNLGNWRRMNMTVWMCVKNIKINEQEKVASCHQNLNKWKNKLEPLTVSLANLQKVCVD